MAKVNYGLRDAPRRTLLQLALKGIGSNLACGFFVNIFAVKELARGCVARFGQAAQSWGVHEVGRQLAERPCGHALAHRINVFQPFQQPGAAVRLNCGRVWARRPMAQ